MAGNFWYEMFPQRLVLEVIRVQSFDSSFRLRRWLGTLCWEGRVVEIPDGVEAPPLHFLIVYPDAFPAIAPEVEIVSPDLDPAEWGHDWHRWRNGDVCYVQPSKWQISTTADEIIKKVGDWYFNYVAKKQGLIEKMPDLGRAALPAQRINEGT